MNGVVPLQSNYESEHTCLHCDGAGLYHGKLCKSCNGHGVIVYDSHKQAIKEYSLTKEQLAAMETLGGMA
jgi:DnaJ-class molecular chaperone